MTRFDRDLLIVQLHPSILIALQKIVGFGQSFVVMPFGIRRDFRDVDGTRIVGYVSKCPAGGAAGTRDPRDLGKFYDLVLLRSGF